MSIDEWKEEFKLMKRHAKGAAIVVFIAGFFSGVALMQLAL